MRAPRVLGRSLAVAAIAAVAVFGAAQSASAHDSLVSTSPASGDTVSTVTEVTLDFSANLLGYDGGNIVVVLGSDGRHYEADCVALAGPTLSVPVELGAPGEYTVEWRAVSSDGHPVSGTFPFTSTAAGASQGSADSPCASAVGSASAPVEASPSEGGGLSGLTVGLLVGGGAIVLVGVLVFVILRTRTRDE